MFYSINLYIIRFNAIKLMSYLIAYRVTFHTLTYGNSEALLKCVAVYSYEIVTM